MMSLLISQLAQAKNGLEDAQINLCGAVMAHAEAKRLLAHNEALKLCEGVEGKNERERAAKLRLELASEYSALAEAEDALTEARCAYKLAWLEWDYVCYQARMLEVAMPLKAAA